MQFRYTPQGVCSMEMIFEIEGDIIKKLEIIGGCPRKHNWSIKTSTRKKH